MSHGENRIVFKRKGRISNETKKISGGKLGLFKYLYDKKKQLRRCLEFHHTTLHQTDGILIYTDGVLDVHKNARLRQRSIQRIFRKTPLLDITLEKINKNAASILRKRNLSASQIDDYTLFGIMKK